MQWGGRTRCWDGKRFGIPDFVGKAAHCEPLPVALELLENLRRPPCQRQRPRKQALASHWLQQHQACPPSPGPPRRRPRQTWARLPPQRRARSFSPNRCLDGVKGSAGCSRTESRRGAILIKRTDFLVWTDTPIDSSTATRQTSTELDAQAHGVRLDRLDRNSTVTRQARQARPRQRLDSASTVPRRSLDSSTARAQATARAQVDPRRPRAHGYGLDTLRSSTKARVDH